MSRRRDEVVSPPPPPPGPVLPRGPRVGAIRPSPARGRGPVRRCRARPGRPADRPRKERIDRGAPGSPGRRWRRWLPACPPPRPRCGGCWRERGSRRPAARRRAPSDVGGPVVGDDGDALPGRRQVGDAVRHAAMSTSSSAKVHRRPSATSARPAGSAAAANTISHAAARREATDRPDSPAPCLVPLRARWPVTDVGVSGLAGSRIELAWRNDRQRHRSWRASPGGGGEQDLARPSNRAGIAVVGGQVDDDAIEPGRQILGGVVPRRRRRRRSSCAR